MSENTKQTQDWTDCPQGEIGGMLRRERFRRRRRFLTQAAGAAGLGALGGFAWLKWQPAADEPAEQDPAELHIVAKISCREVRRHGEAYVEHRNTLDGELVARIDAHVDDCPSCARYLAKIKNKPGKT